MEGKRSRDILAVISSDKKWLGGGKAQTFIAESEEQALALTQEVARAIRGEVISLSNGVFLIVEP